MNSVPTDSPDGKGTVGKVHRSATSDHELCNTQEQGTWKERNTGMEVELWNTRNGTRNDRRTPFHRSEEGAHLITMS